MTQPTYQIENMVRQQPPTINDDIFKETFIDKYVAKWL